MAFDYAEWVDAMLEHSRPSAGDEWTAECPFCHVFGSFYVNCSEEKRGPWVCFKCDERSNSIIRLIAHVEDITPAEVRAMMMKANAEFRRRETTETLSERIRAIREPEELGELDFFHEDEVIGSGPPELIPIWDGKAWNVPTYLTRRGYKRETLRLWDVGYCERGYYAHRVIIPIDCPNGRSFTARDLTGEQQPRYLNPKGMDHRRLLYGWKQTSIHSDFILAEGPFDAMKLDQHGFPAMAVGGKVLSGEQLGMLFARPDSASVTVMFDPGATMEAYNVAAQLVTHFKYVYVATLSGEIDPGASTRNQARRAHGKAIRFTGERAPRVLEAVKKSKEKLQEIYEVKKS